MQNHHHYFISSKNKIESFVTKEIMKPGDQIPSIRDLAYTLGINPNTVKKAYDLLEQKGIIISKSTLSCG